MIRGNVPDLGLAARLEHRFRPLSNGLAIPVFAFFAAGVDVGGANGVMESLTDPVAIGMVLALVVGKLVGIFSAAWLRDRFTAPRGTTITRRCTWVAWP